MYRVAIITASDKGAMGLREDKSGPEIEEACRDMAEVVCYEVIADERTALSAAMRRICDGGLADVIFTTGGTGFSPRDITPEATLDICERLCPGIPEAMRAASMEITDRAMLSRAVSGIRKGTLIINLPGSPTAVCECLESILPALWHGIDMLCGTASECAR
ncbi:MAG: MogA/MoaB family molybdenum cofactor biosynthesis protein [Clostridia bacterium]